jgi:hypothetical protein
MSSLKDKRSARTEPADISYRLKSSIRPAEVLIGRIVSIDEDGIPIVDFPANPSGRPVPALATARYDLVYAGQAVALMFLEGDRARPLAIGVVAQPHTPNTMAVSTATSDLDEPPERLTFSATREIVLQCGRASIVLTRAGKVLMRGAYVSLRSSGMQRITGASVQIN